MEKFCRILFAFFAILLPLRSGHCAAKGTLLKSFGIAPSAVLADPVRGRVYATVPATNSVAVIDTDTLTLTSIFIGSSPQGMAISEDGSLLFVANAGLAIAAIGVLDLNTLTAKASMSAPGAVCSVAVGNNNRLYAVGGTGIFQFNTLTGAYQSTIAQHVYGGYLAVTPDRNTLFYCDELSDRSLDRYDISTGTAIHLQHSWYGVGGAACLVVSHNGQFITFDNDYTVLKLSSSDINGICGTFNVGAYPAAVAFSPDDKRVYAAQYGRGSIHVFDSVTFVELTSYSYAGPSTDPTAITVDRSGAELFVAGTTLDVYSTGLPIVTTGSAASTLYNSAMLSGTVNPNGPGTTYCFQYGLTTAYGLTAITQSMASGTSAVTLSISVSGLNPSTTYHYQLMATNDNGTAYGSDKTVTTPSAPPTYATGRNTKMLYNGATLNAIINPNGLATTYYFKYGLTNDYGIATAKESAGSGTSEVSLSGTLTGLAPGTTYHYQVVATNSIGALYGPDQTFTTTKALDLATLNAHITKSGTDIQVSVKSVAGYSYQLQRVDSLGSVTGWQNIGNPQPGTDAGLVFSDSVSDLANSAFYRVQISQ